METLPAYDDLPEIPGTDLRHAWDVFGPTDRIGTINLLTPDRVAAVARLVTSGVTVSLDLPLNEPNPPLFGRETYRHTVFALDQNNMDDRLDGFFPQASTQWDVLGHVRCREHGYWGGRTDDPISGVNELGIEQVAEHGIAGRGLLVDIAAWYWAEGVAYDPLEPSAISAGDIRSALDAQGVTPIAGDILCVRTGWVQAYRRLDAAGRDAYATAPRFAGLRGDAAVAQMLWDAHVAALVCDNPAVEMIPGDREIGSLHRRLIPCLGMTLGEMFDLEVLVERCREAERWTFLFVAAPFRVPGGLGSPGNALAML